jgi:hypothetical protein
MGTLRQLGADKTKDRTPQGSPVFEFIAAMRPRAATTLRILPPLVFAREARPCVTG